LTSEYGRQEEVADKAAAQLPLTLKAVVHEFQQHAILAQHGGVERYAVFNRWLASFCGRFWDRRHALVSDRNLLPK
jgi:hypothetical protein